MMTFQKTFGLFYPNNLKSNDQAAENYWQQSNEKHIVHPVDGSEIRQTS